MFDRQAYGVRAFEISSGFNDRIAKNESKGPECQRSMAQ
jgi:hypothetical protein